jgi:hypothetical protein
MVKDFLWKHFIRISCMHCVSMRTLRKFHKKVPSFTTRLQLEKINFFFELNNFLNFSSSGIVVGLLKVGRKSLYVFDKYGDTKHVNAPCVLDFYIHESRQRGGLGKTLFEHMLEYENLLPEQMAIDRPSEKLLSFLRKHYGN